MRTCRARRPVCQWRRCRGCAQCVDAHKESNEDIDDEILNAEEIDDEKEEFDDEEEEFEDEMD